MDTKLLTSAEAKEKSAQVLQQLPFVSMATLGTDGFPDLRMMAVAARDGMETLWFGTSTDAKKVTQLKANPNAVIYGYHPETMREFRIFGKIELLNDSASRKKIWHDDFLQYFPEGVDSPTLVVLRFDVDHGEYASYGEGQGTF